MHFIVPLNEAVKRLLKHLNENEYHMPLFTLTEIEARKYYRPYFDLTYTALTCLNF